MDTAELDGYPPHQEWPHLAFLGAHGVAAAYLYSNTSLKASPIVTPHIDDKGRLTGVTINPNIRPSSGEEQVLLPLLWALSTSSHRMPPPLMFTAVDEDTQRACWFAIGIGLGCIGEPLPLVEDRVPRIGRGPDGIVRVTRS